uniref:Putative salivary lipocalin lipocalin n=1 Tax=Rhipicephalus microplus TaxID=6941 RepID=A0A6G5A6T5_RHIMP
MKISSFILLTPTLGNWPTTRHIPTIMSCNTLPFVVLLCVLPSGYITVYGSREAGIIPKTRQFLKQTGDLYLVGYSGESKKESNLKKYGCMYSKPIPRDDQAVNHNLVFEEYDDSETPTTKEIMLELVLMEPKKILIAQMNTPNPPQGYFNIVYLGTQCIILGSGSEKKGRQACTMWIRKDAISNHDNDCEWFFIRECHNPTNFISMLSTYCEQLQK